MARSIDLSGAIRRWHRPFTIRLFVKDYADADEMFSVILDKNSATVSARFFN